MLIGVHEIKVEPHFAKPDMERVKTLASRMKTLGLLCPIIVDGEYNLISGLCRLEAAKLIGWSEIECEVKTSSCLETELAEIDAIFLSKNLSELRTCIHRHFAPFRRSFCRYVSAFFAFFSGDKMDAFRF